MKKLSAIEKMAGSFLISGKRTSAGDNIPGGIEKQGREERRKKKIRDERK